MFQAAMEIDGTQISNGTSAQCMADGFAPSPESLDKPLTTKMRHRFISLLARSEQMLAIRVDNPEEAPPAILPDIQPRTDLMVETDTPLCEDQTDLQESAKLDTGVNAVKNEPGFVSCTIKMEPGSPKPAKAGTNSASSVENAVFPHVYDGFNEENSVESPIDSSAVSVPPNNFDSSAIKIEPGSLDCVREYHCVSEDSIGANVSTEDENESFHEDAAVGFSGISMKAEPLHGQDEIECSDGAVSAASMSVSAKMTGTTATKKTVISVKERREICNFKEKNPSYSQQFIASHFSLLWDKRISRRTVGDILSEREKWLQEDLAGNAKRLKQPKHEGLEDALVIWIGQVNAQHGCVTDAIIKEQAAVFGSKMGITGFKYSNGWLGRFKQRRGISLANRHDEPAEVNEDVVRKGCHALSRIMEAYDPRDVYNMDKSALLYRLQPDKTISMGPMKGYRKAKDRVTLAFCTNSDGSDKRTVTVIGKSARPRCFRNFNPALYVTYRNNKKAWMTAIEFDEWLRTFNSAMKSENRHVLLLLDNAMCHKKQNLSNVRIEFLPGNCAGVLQPLDAGIIRCFKAHYRQHQVKHIIDCISNNNPVALPLKDALYMIKKAWDDVTPEAIHNSWAHTGLISRNYSSVSEENSARELRESLEQLRASATIEHPMSAEEFLAVEDETPTSEEMSTDDIVQMVLCQTEGRDDGDGKDDGEDELVPTVEEAKESLVKLRKFLEKHCDDTNAMNHVVALDSLVGKIGEKQKTQSLIQDFYSQCN